jgi:Hsp70 protein
LYSAWPGLGVGDTQKVPSRISYGLPPEHKIEWGYEIKPSSKATVHALMKLKLDEKLKKSKQLKLILAYLSSQMDGITLDDVEDDSEDEDGPPDYPGKGAVDIVADYLKEVRKSFMEHLNKQYGAVLISTLRKELIITVPAVWSERAKDLTLKAVGQAGFEANSISMITEPEAAAVYTLKGMTEGVCKDDVEIGDYFVMCDAGGGTVDLISYKITQLNPVFLIEEAAVGSGDKCGATYVDKEFLSWFEKLIGAEAYRKIPRQKTRYGSSFMNAFEILKQHFSGVEDGVEISIPRECGIEDDEAKNIEDRILTMSW